MCHWVKEDKLHFSVLPYISLAFKEKVKGIGKSQHPFTEKKWRPDLEDQ
jgi:hypothetical protein